jgi:hypothetical protein
VPRAAQIDHGLGMQGLSTLEPTTDVPTTTDLLGRVVSSLCRIRLYTVKSAG